MDEGSPQAMLVAATAGLSAGIEAWDRVALHVDDLGPPVDPETAITIVPDRIECRRVKWWLVDPVHRRIAQTGRDNHPVPGFKGVGPSRGKWLRKAITCAVT